MPTARKSNGQLARLIREAGFSNKGLADRIVRLGVLRDAPNLRYNHSSVARWLRGEQPRHPVPEIIAEVFTIELGRRVSVPELGMKPNKFPRNLGLDLPTSQTGIAGTVSALLKADLDQQPLVDAEIDSAAFAATALRWLVGPWDPTLAPTRGRRVGAGDVEEIRQVTHAFRILDNRLGGGHVRSPVIEYLHTHVSPLLRDGQATEEIRRQLFAAAADLTKLAAWLYHDLDKQGIAQRYFIQALAMARFAGDEGLNGEVLAAMSQQALFVAQPATAVDLARSAQTAARRAGLPVLTTECLMMEAHGYAAQRQARLCAHALARADKAYERATADDLPEWLAYFDEAYLAARIAHCFRELGQAAETEKYALRSLNMDRSYRRGKTFNIAMLAMALATQGRIDEACEKGRTAIDMAAGLTSARVYRYILDLARAFGPYKAESDVRELMAYAEDRLPALRARGVRP